MAFLQVPGAGGIGHVLELLPLDVFEQDVGDQPGVRHPSRSEIEVEIAVVVDIAAVDRHGGDRAIEIDVAGHVAELSGAEITVQSGRARKPGDIPSMSATTSAWLIDQLLMNKSSRPSLSKSQNKQGKLVRG